MGVRRLLVAVSWCVVPTACQPNKSDVAPGDVSQYVASDGSVTIDVDVTTYNLDMDRIRHWVAGIHALTAAALTDSVLAAAIALKSDEPVLRSITRLQDNRKARALLWDVGLTPREYVMTTLAYRRGVRAEAATRADPRAMPAAGANARNLAFIRAHRTELATMVRP